MSRTEVTAPILVVGATGKTGRRVAEKLTAQGLPVRGVSRSSSPSFDWEAPEGWAAALAGTSSVYVTYAPDLAVPGAVDAVRQFTDLALELGVKRIVLMSGRGEAEAQQAEDVLRASDADWTVIRASWFAQNFSETFLLDEIRTGTVALPIGPVKEPFIDAEDIADVAVAALTDPKHIGKVYEVTGPRLLSFEEAVGEIAAATGQQIQYVQVSVEDYIAALRQQQVPEDVIWLLEYLFTTVLDGRGEVLADGVREALGRDARDFGDYLRDTASSGVWRKAA